MVKKAQFQIQQMAFMIVALFIFFVIAGLFTLRLSLKDLKGDAQDFKTEKAISFLNTLPEMTEFSFDGKCVSCLDKDKLRAFGGFSNEYKIFFPLDSLKATRVYPEPTNIEEGNVQCPSLDCIVLFTSAEDNLQEYATFVSVCEKSRNAGITSEKCEVWKLVAGIKLIE